MACITYKSPILGFQLRNKRDDASFSSDFGGPLAANPGPTKATPKPAAGSGGPPPSLTSPPLQIDTGVVNKIGGRKIGGIDPEIRIATGTTTFTCSPVK